MLYVGPIDAYSKEELYLLYSKVSELCNASDNIINNQNDMIDALKTALKEKDSIIERYKNLSDRMLNIMKESSK